MKKLNFKVKTLVIITFIFLLAVPVVQAMLRPGRGGQQRSPFITATLVAAGATLAALLGISAKLLWKYIERGSGNRIQAPQEGNGLAAAVAVTQPPVSEAEMFGPVVAPALPVPTKLQPAKPSVQMPPPPVKPTASVVATKQPPAPTAQLSSQPQQAQPKPLAQPKLQPVAKPLSGKEILQQLKSKDLILNSAQFDVAKNKQINLYQIKVVDQYLKNNTGAFIFGGAASCAYHAIKNGNALLELAFGEQIYFKDRLYDVEFAKKLISPPNGIWRTLITSKLMPALIEIVNTDPAMAGKQVTPQMALDFFNRMAPAERPFSQEDLQGDWLDLHRIQLLLEHVNASALQLSEIVIISNAETEINKIKAVNKFPTLFILGTMTGSLQKGHWLAVLVTKDGTASNYFIANSGGDHDFDPILRGYIAGLIKAIDGERAVEFIQGEQAAQSLSKLEAELATMAAEIKKANYRINFDLFNQFRDYYGRYKEIIPGSSEFDAVYTRTNSIVPLEQ